jgi:tetratricopeptide (TPR) repeat protein
MKKTFWAIIGVIAMLLASCATTGSNDPDALSLDAAIEQSAREIGEVLPQGMRIAIVAFDSQSANLSDYVMEELTGALLEYQMEVADRNNLEYVRKELNLQLSGEVSDETAQSIGKFVGAQSVITGQLVNTGGGYRFRISSIRVETAVRETSARLNVRNDRELKNLIAALGSNKTVSRSANYGVTENTQPQTAGAFLDRGVMFASRGDFDLAIEDFSEAIKLDSSFVSAYLQRGKALMASVSKGLSDIDENFESFTSFSIVNDSKENDRAINDFDTAIKLDPNSASAYRWRGNAYDNKGDYDRAIADYNQAIKLDPKNASAYLNRGVAYNNKGDYNRAIADYNQAIKLDPKDADAYYNRGLAYNNKGNYDRAIADYNQAIRLDPNDADAYNNRGLAYYNKGDYRRARTDWTEALRLDPNQADARSNLELLQ